eukprot:TRINITY_DN11523_c0_g1_i1.p1 TRINITY_DN11523_c0_g1~~TRINITY_DN11523_c0_g1_i1.p1  ORF type:complete len:369 (-),score=39.48 TRINITY_DN11523_c0_g1_i1:76-1182(-)
MMNNKQKPTKTNATLCYSREALLSLQSGDYEKWPSSAADTQTFRPILKAYATARRKKSARFAPSNKKHNKTQKKIDEEQASFWVPFIFRQPPRNKLLEEQILDEFIREIQVLLNKLTFTTYSVIVTNILESFAISKAANAAKIAAFLRIVFTKAQMEISFSGMYCSICKDLILKLPLRLPGDFTPADLRRNLLVICQEEFEKHEQYLVAQTQPKTLMQMCGECLDGAQSEIGMLPHDLQDYMTRKSWLPDSPENMLRHRKLSGLIVFICELYKHGLLATSVINYIIQRVFDRLHRAAKPCVDDVEILAKMIESCQTKLPARAPKRYRLYIKDLEPLSKSHKLSTRCRCILADVCDLVQSSQKPRRSRA